jgi:WD40 repeat protein
MSPEEKKDIPPSPYRGMHPFRYADKACFYGRDETVSELLAKVLVSRLVVLFGESGTGKSSLINAGLFPALEKEGRRPERLRFAPIPEEPIQVERVQGIGGDDARFLPSVFFDEHSAEANSSGSVVTRSLEEFLRAIHETDARSVLIFDQFEELFTLFGQDGHMAVEQERIQADLLNAIVGIANNPTLMVKVVIVIREDFLGNLEVLAEGYPKVLDHRVRLGYLDQDAARKAILGPFEDPNPFPSRLTPELADEVIGQLCNRRPNVRIKATQLQIVCSRLWDTYASTRSEIEVAQFKKLGWVKGIIEGYLESELSAIRPDLREQAVVILSHLITEAGTRDVVSEDHLKRLITRQEDRNAEVSATSAILKQLEERRVVYRTSRRDTHYFELAHEYLIKPIQKRAREVDLLRAARRARDKMISEVIQIIAVVVVVAFLIVGGLAIKAVAERDRAEKLYRLSMSRQLAAAAVNNLTIDPELSLLLALQAVMVTYSEDRTVTSEAEGALHRAMHAPIAQRTLSGHTGAVRDIAFSPDGKRLATASADGTAKVWDLASAAAATGQELFTLGHDDWVYDIAFSPDGQRLATASRDGTAKMWDVASEEELFTLSGHGGAVWDIAFSPDGKRLATGSRDGTAKVWDLASAAAASGQEVFTLTGHTDVVYSIAFSPDGKRLATASADGTAKLWSTDSGQELFTLVHTDWVYGVSFSPDGTHLVTASADGTAKVWNVAVGTELFTLSGHTKAVTDIAVSPDGKRLATASADGTAKVWNVAVGTELFSLSGHTDVVYGVTFSPDGTRLVTASADGTAKVWSTDSGQELPTLLGHADWVYGVSFSRDGTRLATASADRTAKIWKVDSGEESFILTGHTDIVHDVAFSPECVSPPEAPAERCGTRLATASADQTMKIWDADSGEELSSLSGHTDAVWDVAFSTDGQRLATASRDGTAKIWDADSGEELFSLPGHTDVVWQVTFSPDGTRLATASADGTAKVWDVSSRKELFTLADHTDVVFGVAFSPDGTRLATASRDKTARLWALEASADDNSVPRLLNLYLHDDSVYGVAFNAIGTRLATATGDGTALVWDAESSRKLFSLSGQTGAVWDIAFSPDGKRLATASPDGTVRVYVLGIEELITLAKQRATRSLTPEECLQYLHLEQCPPLP